MKHATHTKANAKIWSALQGMLLCFLLLPEGSPVHAQNVGIGTSQPHASARLEIYDTLRGILIPRLTTSQRNAIASPAHALLIFNVDSFCLEAYDTTGGGTWRKIGCICPGGNAPGSGGGGGGGGGTNPGQSFQDSFCIAIGGPADDYGVITLELPGYAGYFLIGYTNSFTNGGFDIYIARIDTDGNLICERAIGIANTDELAYDAIFDPAIFKVTIVGAQKTTTSLDRGFLIQVDTQCQIQWKYLVHHGNNSYDESPQSISLYPFPPGGYLLTGWMPNATQGSPSISFGRFLNIQPSGNAQNWSYLVNYTTTQERFTSVVPNNLGYVLLGGLVYPSPRLPVVVLFNPASGTPIWSKRFSGAQVVIPSSLPWDQTVVRAIQTWDNNYVVAWTVDDNGTSRGYDFMVAKINNAANSILWIQRIGGNNDEIFMDLIETPDSTLILVGATQSFGAGGYDVYVVALDHMGALLWDAVIGGSSHDWGQQVTYTSDGGLLITGYTASPGLSSSAPRPDIFVIKLDPSGNPCTSCAPSILSNQGSILTVNPPALQNITFQFSTYNYQAVNAGGTVQANSTTTPSCP